MGNVTEEFRGMLRERGTVPACGYDLDGNKVMEDRVTTVQVGDGTLGTLTFEEGVFGLECQELTPEQAMWLVNAPDVQRLLVDALAVVVGWGLMYTAMAGKEPDDVSQYPMATAARLVERADALRIEV